MKNHMPFLTAFKAFLYLKIGTILIEIPEERSTRREGCYSVLNGTAQSSVIQIIYLRSQIIRLESFPHVMTLWERESEHIKGHFKVRDKESERCCYC